MLEQIEHPFDKNVYSVCLFTIEKDEQINSNDTSYGDMTRLNRKPVLNLFVRPTLSKDYVKEIITGLLIPVYTSEIKVTDQKDFFDEYFIEVPNYSPVHIMAYTNKTMTGKDIYFCDDYEWFDKEINEFLYHTKNKCIVTNNQINRYLTRHRNKEQFEKEIMAIFQRAEKTLQDVLKMPEMEASLRTGKTLKRVKR